VSEAESARDTGADAEQIRMQIEQTRGDMSETIDAIQERLSPRNLVEQAKDTVREATVGKVKDMANSVSETAADVADSTRQAAGDVAERVRENPWPATVLGLGAAWLLLRNGSFGRPQARYYGVRGNQTGGNYGQWRRDAVNGDGADGGFMATVRENPVPAALAGVGLGWLAMKAGGRQSGQREYDTAVRDWRRPGDSADQYRVQRGASGATTGVAEGMEGAYDRAKETVSDAAGRAQEVASETFERTQQKVGALTSRARYQTEDLLQSNPLVLGVVAVAVGAAVGLSLPETEPENRMMGEVRDTFVERAQDAAQSAVEKVKDVASDAAGTLGQ